MQAACNQRLRPSKGQRQRRIYRARDPIPRGEIEATVACCHSRLGFGRHNSLSI